MAEGYGRLKTKILETKQLKDIKIDDLGSIIKLVDVQFLRYGVLESVRKAEPDDFWVWVKLYDQESMLVPLVIEVQFLD